MGKIEGNIPYHGVQRKGLRIRHHGPNNLLLILAYLVLLFSKVRRGGFSVH
jgi:hypothetical protein